MIDKEKIEGDTICRLKHKGTIESSLIFCDKIEYLHDKSEEDRFGDIIFDHHLMFYNKKKLIFKVYLPNEKNDKEFSDVFEALESVGIKVNRLESQK